MTPDKITTLKCNNCGDPYKPTKNIIGDREKKGWCVGCYTQWMASYRGQNLHTGETRWSDRRGGTTPFDARPEYNKE